jgi:glutamyl-tRNA synthetase
LLFGNAISLDEKATTQLQIDGVGAVLKDVLAAIKETPELDEAKGKEIINQVTKAHGVKKGLVMKSLRAGLMGELQGPDLMQSWVLLHQKGWDGDRLAQALQAVS